jgi:hypothetical protein
VVDNLVVDNLVVVNLVVLFSDNVAIYESSGFSKETKSTNEFISKLFLVLTFLTVIPSRTHT